jgi:murein DD-endopeptidase MepM/ murein hydrolase activator NlpD
MSLFGRRGAAGSRVAHLAAWALVLALILTLAGSILPLGVGVTPAVASTSLEKARADLAQAKKDLKALQTKLDKLAAQQSGAEDDLEETKIRIEQVQTRIDAANEDLTSRRGQLAGRLSEMYKNRGSDALNVLNVVFSGEDTSINAVLEHLSMVTRVAQSDTELINAVKGRVHELNSLRAELRAEKAVEQKKTAKYENARDKTLQSLEDAKDEYNRLRSRVVTLQAEARKRAEEARKAEAAKKAAEAAAAANRKTTATTAHRTTTTTVPDDPAYDPDADFVFPVAGPNSFSDTFGAPRSGGRRHQGCDIFTARNTPIVAVVDGVITRVNPYDSGLGGISAYLRGGDRTVYYYAHLSSIKSGIHAGVHVEAGQVIGYAGNTGNASGGAVHLHFEIRPNGGAAINPYPILIKYR